MFKLRSYCWILAVALGSALPAETAFAYIPYCYECQTNPFSGKNVCYAVNWDGYDLCWTFGGNACGYTGFCYVG
jgi:uncharacterized membrane protein